MNTNKLCGALADMEAQRLVLDQRIEAICRVIATLEGQTIEAAPSSIEPNEQSHGSYIDHAVELFQKMGKPMHVKDTAARFSETRGTSVSRASLESSFIRHINKSAKPRIAKFGPRMFGLATWKQTQPALAQIA